MNADTDADTDTNISTRRTSLTQLLHTFNKFSDLDPSGLYFLCNMDDTFLLANVLDGVCGLTLREKYVWSLAPVNHDDPQVMVWYTVLNVPLSSIAWI